LIAGLAFRLFFSRLLSAKFLFSRLLSAKFLFSRFLFSKFLFTVGQVLLSCAAASILALGICGFFQAFIFVEILPEKLYRLKPGCAPSDHKNFLETWVKKIWWVRA
jgi:hypothetical protein